MLCVGLITQSCPTLCERMVCSPPGSSVHEVSQARILKWVAISYSRESSWPRIESVSLVFPAFENRFFTTVPPGKSTPTGKKKKLKNRAAAAAKSLQSCPTLCDPTDYSPPGSTVQGILQARILEWFAISYSRESSWPRDQTLVSCIAGSFFTVGATRDYTQFMPTVAKTAYLWYSLSIKTAHGHKMASLCYQSLIG